MVAPRVPVAAAALQGEPRRIHHNCSGKHASGRAVRVRGLAGRGLPRGHPPAAARDGRRGLGALARRGADQAVDGCGMLTFRAPLAALAGAFGRLASGGLGQPGTRVAGALRAHPALVAYPGALDTELMAALPVAAKIGAEGVIAIGCPDGRGAGGQGGRRRAARARPGRGVGGGRAARPPGQRSVRARCPGDAADPQLARRGRRSPRRGAVLLADDRQVVRASDRGPAKRPTTGCQSADTLPRCPLPSASTRRSRSAPPRSSPSRRRRAPTRSSTSRTPTSGSPAPTPPSSIRSPSTVDTPSPSQADDGTIVALQTPERSSAWTGPAYATQ